MRNSRVTDEPIVAIVREAGGGTRLSQRYRRHGILQNALGL